MREVTATGGSQIEWGQELFDPTLLEHACRASPFLAVQHVSSSGFDSHLLGQNEIKDTWKKLQLPETEARGATGSGSGKRLRRVAVGRRVEVTEKVLVMFNQI